MMLKIFFLSLFVISGFFIIDVNAQNKNTFIIEGYTITTFSDHITNISLNWNSELEGPTAIITFDKLMNEEISLQIPKSMPRITNLDFGHFSLHAIQTDGSWHEIKETESECYYILEIPVVNSDYIEIEASSVAAGRWESVSISNDSCNEFSLKQQIENNIPIDKIECKNKGHILTERPNGKLACVFENTAEKLNWKITTKSFELIKDDMIFDIKYDIKRGIITDMIQSDKTSLLIIIDSRNDGEITLYIPHGVIDPIPKDNGDNFLFVLVNGEEVESDQFTNDELDRIVTLKFSHTDPEIEIIAAYWG